MRYATAEAFRTALEQRLTTRAEETGVPPVRLRKLVVFDRLMARLAVAAPGRWILKGSVAIHYRIGPQFRTTMDMDIGRADDEEAATEDFLAAQSAELDDYFTFAIERVGSYDSSSDLPTVRYHATAQIAGRRFEDITIDVGFGDPIASSPEMLRGPDLLEFADIPPAEVQALPLEEHVAEKVHAYTRTYSGGPSTRVKDLIDLAAISSLFPLKAERLRRSLDTTFEFRATHELPGEFPPPPSEWQTPYRTMAAEANVNPDISIGFGQVRMFLDPVLASALHCSATWNPTTRSWQAPD